MEKYNFEMEIEVSTCIQYILNTEPTDYNIIRYNNDTICIKWFRNFMGVAFIYYLYPDFLELSAIHKINQNSPELIFSIETNMGLFQHVFEKNYIHFITNVNNPYKETFLRQYENLRNEWEIQKQVYALID